MTDEWLNEIENFGQRRERMLEEIEGVLSCFGGDILDNSPEGSGRYLSDHLQDLMVRWAKGAMKHERERCAAEVESWRGGKLLLMAGDMNGGGVAHRSRSHSRHCSRHSIRGTSMRRFNGWTLAMKAEPMGGSGKHLCSAGRMLAWARKLNGRIATWREPMRKVR